MAKDKDLDFAYIPGPLPNTYSVRPLRKKGTPREKTYTMADDHRIARAEEKVRMEAKWKAEGRNKVWDENGWRKRRNPNYDE